MPTFNRSNMILDALESLTKQTLFKSHDIEILVVDNASTDKTETVLKDFIDKNPSYGIKYCYEEKKGQAHALNTGIKNSRGKWLAFFDDDQLAEPNWLEELLNVAINKNTKYVGGAVHLDISEEELDKLNEIERKFQREIKYYDEPHIYDKKIYQLPSSGNMFIERSVFDNVGYFDGSMLTGAFDTDLCLRARKLGYVPWFAPQAIIRHRIAENRTTTSYIKWGEIKNGATLAYLDHKYRGKTANIFFCIARLGQALIIKFPLLILGSIVHNKVRTQESLFMLYRAFGYCRKTTSLFIPKIFNQKKWWNSLAQREGLKIGTSTDVKI
jgi:glycosyltransferase involved in cell wall biosynthesis